MKPLTGKEDNMQFRVEKPVGKHPVGVYVSEDDFTDGRTAELVEMGILTPMDGGTAEPKTLSEWKQKAKTLEAKNAELRLGKPDVAKVHELEEENANLKAELEKQKTINAEMGEGMVSKAEHDNLKDQHEQLKRLHETTVKELEELKAK